jgi:hypothetical protein
MIRMQSSKYIEKSAFSAAGRTHKKNPLPPRDPQRKVPEHPSVLFLPCRGTTWGIADRNPLEGNDFRWSQDLGILRENG